MDCQTPGHCWELISKRSGFPDQLAGISGPYLRLNFVNDQFEFLSLDELAELARKRGVLGGRETVVDKNARHWEEHTSHPPTVPKADVPFLVSRMAQ